MVSRAVVERRGGNTTLRLRPHPGPIDRTARDDELHLGSQDLLRLADYASQSGFKLSSFALSDSDLYPLPREEQDEISKHLIELYKKFGLKELMAALNDEYGGIYAVGITILNHGTGRRINIRRRGFVDASMVEEAEKLLLNALKDLNLS